MNDVRLVLFGPVTAESKEIGRSTIREALMAVAKGQEPNAVPREAVEWGLLVHTRSRWAPGPRLVCLPHLQWSQAVAIREAGRECAGVVSDALPDLKKALSSAIDGEPESLWRRYAFMTVAALLLDLEIGETLRRSGQVEKVAPGWHVWAVPHDPLVPAFGVRCVHDPTSGLGAGICWHERLFPAAPLPEPRDLPAFAAVLAGKPTAPEALVRLRFGGWLHGRCPSAPLLASHNPLWAVLEEVAGQAVERAYAPILDLVPDRSATNQERLVLTRMIMEEALERLISTEAVPTTGAGAACRWLWQGRPWSLAVETTDG